MGAIFDESNYTVIDLFFFAFKQYMLCHGSGLALAPKCYFLFPKISTSLESGEVGGGGGVGGLDEGDNVRNIGRGERWD